jgi:hypothetical protein
VTREATTPKGWKVTLMINDRPYRQGTIYGCCIVWFGRETVGQWSNDPFAARGNRSECEAMRDADKVIEAFRAEFARQAQGALPLEVS